MHPTREKEPALFRVQEKPAFAREIAKCAILQKLRTREEIRIEFTQNDVLRAVAFARGNLNKF